MRKSTVSWGSRSKCVTSDESNDVGNWRLSNVERTRAVAVSGEFDTRSSVSVRVAAYASLSKR